MKFPTEYSLYFPIGIGFLTLVVNSRIIPLFGGILLDWWIVMSLVNHKRKQVSRLTAISLLLVLSVSLFGCGGAEEEPKKSGQFKMNQSEYYGG